MDHGAEAIGLEHHRLVEAHLAAADAGRGAVEAAAAAAAVAAAGAEARGQLGPPHGCALDQHGWRRGGAPAAGERDAGARAGVGGGAAVGVGGGVVAGCARGSGVVWVGVAVVGFFDDGEGTGGAVVVVVEGLGAGAHGG